jgi:hypothetical protein
VELFYANGVADGQLKWFDQGAVLESLLDGGKTRIARLKAVNDCFGEQLPVLADRLPAIGPDIKNRPGFLVKQQPLLVKERVVRWLISIPLEGRKPTHIEPQ